MYEIGLNTIAIKKESNSAIPWSRDNPYVPMSQDSIGFFKVPEYSIFLLGRGEKPLKVNYGK